MMTIERDWLSIAVAQVWQVAALAVLVALAVKLFARQRPHLAYVLWLLVLVKCLTPPLWGSPAGIFSWAESALQSAPFQTVASADGLSTAPSASHNATVVEPANFHGLAEPFARGPDVVVRLGDSEFAIDGTHTIVRPVSDEQMQSWSWLGWSLLGWLGGTLVIVAVATIRWIRCWRHLRASREVTSPALAATFADLVNKLGLRRRVNLLVTSSRIGPAVVGLFRPTVILPVAVVHGRSIDDLQPILAHELIHERRGDLWIGFVQVIAQAIWWFHPLVWFTGRMISREAERCCDEEVLAELGCSPARYARSLLAVLELKRTLTPVPAFPGVRAVELTTARMERIMTLGPGCRRRTPWWCWGVLLLSAAVVLPGAALIQADEPSESRSGPEIPRVLVEDALERDLELERQLYEQGSPLTSENAYCPHWTHDARPLLSNIQQELKLEEHWARSALLKHLCNRLLSDMWLRNELEIARQVNFRGSAIVYEGECEPGGELKRLRVQIRDDGFLVIEQRPHHVVNVAPVMREFTRIERALRDMEVFGFGSVQLEVSMISGPVESIEALGSKWTTFPAIRSEKAWSENESLEMESIEPLNEHGDGAEGFAASVALGKATRGRAMTAVEEVRPVLLEVLNRQRSKHVVDHLQSRRDANVLCAPRMILYNGQSGRMSDISKSFFVVGIEPVNGQPGKGRPQVQVIRQGVQLQTRAILKENMVQLSFHVLTTRLVDVKEKSVPLGTVQVPVVARHEIESTIKVPLGDTLLVSGSTFKNAKDEEMASVILLTVAKPQANGPERAATYSVVDLVRPKSNFDRDGRIVPGPAQADFAPLIELIESTIEPRSWDRVGGKNSIVAFPTNLAVVVTATPDVHSRIAALLASLRHPPDAMRPKAPAES